MILGAAVFARGFFSSDPVHTALLIAGLVAIIAGPLGVFTVIRGQAFAGEAFGDIGTTGGAGAFLLGAGPLWGFLVINVVAAAVMQLIGVERRRGRDLATGVVLGAGLAVSALLLYLDTTVHNTTGAAQTILFGSLFTIEGSLVVPAIVLAVIVLALLGTIARPLLLASLSPELAAARGIPVSRFGALYLLALALAVALCALTIGSILSTALLVGPAAAALRITRRPLLAAVVSAAIGLGAGWLGIVLSYDSYDWPPHGTGWPVSFFVVCLVFVVYLGCGLAGAARRGRAGAGSPRGIPELPEIAAG
jgi:zinc/manganese transport system permease protein